MFITLKHKLQQGSISTRNQADSSLDKMASMTLTGDEKHSVPITSRIVMLSSLLF